MSVMPATDSPPLTTASILGPLVGPTATALKRVREQIRDVLQHSDPEVDQILRHAGLLGGKGLRPALLLLCGEASGSIRSNHIAAGAVLELLHVATLIHDDVLDAAQQRRHVATISSRWNDRIAVLTGDLLLAKAYALAATTGSTYVCQKVADAAIDVAAGETMQTVHVEQWQLAEADYLEMIRGKTAALCRVACQIGAALAEASETTVEALGNFGERLGMAFQVADDVLDVWGSPQQTGKTLGTDLIQGKATLPVVHMLRSLSVNDREEALRILEGPAELRLTRLQPFLASTDAYDYSMQYARRLADEAERELAVLPTSSACETLHHLCNTVVYRKS